jgi:hypothetical protein
MSVEMIVKKRGIERWYPGLKIENNTKKQPMKLHKAA